MERFRFFAEIAEWKNNFLLVSKTFVVKRFARNAAFREMERQCADRIMKMDYPLEVGFKADLTSKM